MARATVKDSFDSLLKYPPHKDITAINKFIVTGCFIRTTADILSFIKRSGYNTNLTYTLSYVNLIKSQLSKASKKFGERVEIDFFCDVAGTKNFDDFMNLCDKDDFYQGMIKYNPDYNSCGGISNLKRKAFQAVLSAQTKDEFVGVSYITEALEHSLKKIGINPFDEINGISKSSILTMHLMDCIGGIQIYLPKSHPLKRIIADIDIYEDSFKMEFKQMAIKYGLTYKTISLVMRRTLAAIKEYEGANETK